MPSRAVNDSKSLTLSHKGFGPHDLRGLHVYVLQPIQASRLTDARPTP